MDPVEYEALTDTIAVLSEILLVLSAARLITAGQESTLQRRLEAAKVMLSNCRRRQS